jgi:hypothetical protein
MIRILSAAGQILAEIRMREADDGQGPFVLGHVFRFTRPYSVHR